MVDVANIAGGNVVVVVVVVVAVVVVVVVVVVVGSHLVGLSRRNAMHILQYL